MNQAVIKIAGSTNWTSLLHTKCIAGAENGLEVPFAATGNWGYPRFWRPDYGDAELEKRVKRVREQARREVFVFSTTIFRPFLSLLVESVTLATKEMRGY